MWSRQTYAPILILSTSIDGNNVTDATDLLRNVISFKYKWDLKKASVAEFSMWNWDKLLEDPRFFANAVWRFRFGYFDDVSDIHTMVVREIDPHYSDKRTVNVKLYDYTLNLSANSSSTNWGKIPSSEVAKKIAKRYGMEAIVTDSADTPKKAWIQAGDINDIEFLRDLAAPIDFEVFVADSPPVLFYRKKPYDKAAAGTLTYYSDVTENSFVLSFEPKIKGLGPVKSGASSTHESTSTSTGERSNQALAAYQLEVRAESGTSTVVQGNVGTSKPVPSGANTTQLAHANRQTLLDNAHEATSSHPLTPSIKPGRTYVWAGELDKGLLGKWYLQTAEYEMSGTKSSLKCHWKRNAKNDGKKTNPNTNPKGDDSGVEVQGDTGTSRVR